MLTAGAPGLQKRKAAAVRGGLQRTGADEGLGMGGLCTCRPRRHVEGSVPAMCGGKENLGEAGK